MAIEPIIRLINVSKTYDGRHGTIRAIDNISLDIMPGEFVCVVGPSGCGKSTLLNLIAGLAMPETGEVLVSGKKVEDAGSDRVLMFQESALFPWLTVIENVEFGLKIKGIPGAERRRIALGYLELVQLASFSDAFVHELSGGMKQRVALARSLAIEPSILLMDEPFASLDAQARDSLHVELQRVWMKTKKTMVFITHNVSEAVCLGDRVLVIGWRPVKLKKEFRITYPRPREHRGNHELARLTSRVLNELKAEFENSKKEELG